MDGKDMKDHLDLMKGGRSTYIFLEVDHGK